MLNIRDEIMAEIYKRGVAAEVGLVDKIETEVEQAMLDLGLYKIIEDSVAKHDTSKQLTFSDIEIGKSYSILPIAFMKKTLHNHSGIVKEKNDDGETVLLEMTSGRHKNSKIKIEAYMLKK